MPERPLLVLPSPAEPSQRHKKNGGGGPPHLPGRVRQGERIAPRFDALQRTFERRQTALRAEAAGAAPEEVIVLEIAGDVAGFVDAVRKIEGLEWLAEVEEEDIPPDDDFFAVNKKGERKPGKVIRGRMFLVFSNQVALRQVLSLWNKWQRGEALPHGLGPWDALFAQLIDVRPWGVQDRLLETGVMDDWEERVKLAEEVVPCEVELWFRNSPQKRDAAKNRVAALVHQLEGKVLHEATIEDIAYHALLVELPLPAVRTLVAKGGKDVSLVQCESIQFFRACGQMVAPENDGDRAVDQGVSLPPSALREPVVALLDGLPLQLHAKLAGRLTVDDPDGYESQYPATQRRHGTAMASLIVHGDLDAGEAPLDRAVYVRPILRPDPRDFREYKAERVREDVLVVDLIHRAIRRLVEGERGEPPVARRVCVVNLSIGIADRMFTGPMSPFARLLDWLAWRYQILFLVSAGNHGHDIELQTTPAVVSRLDAKALQGLFIRAVAADTRNRRLLSPAEAINVVTVGALSHDSSVGATFTRGINPLVDSGLPSLTSAHGMGYRRAIKPDILVPGGRTLLSRRPGSTSATIYQVSSYASPPGQRVAAPGPSSGDLSYTWYTRGTSNATALASRAASQLFDILQELRATPGGATIDEIPPAVWLKTLLVHSASWGSGGEILDGLLRTPQNTQKFREYVTRLLGYGVADPARVKECTPFRVTALGGGTLRPEMAHVHRFPLPPSLSGKRLWRRVTVTLSWLTPVNPMHQSWRRAELWFEPPVDVLKLNRMEADAKAVQRGTVQHEVLEGDKAAAFVDGDNLEVYVNCRATAGILEDSVPYALATTVEVAQEIGVDVYDEVRVRLAARVQVIP